LPVVKRLPHKLGIVLPSKDRDGKPLGRNLMKRIRARTLRWFKDFGGSTEERRDLRGTYVAAKGQVIQERVTYVWTFCTTAQFRQSRRELVDLAEAICRDARQQAVGILVDEGMELVQGRKREVD